MKLAIPIVAALAAMPLPAVSQSSVTLYGIVDVGLQWNQFGVNNGTSSAPNFSQESVWGIESGYQSGSRFGVRGSEVLGRGWSAIFTLEGGIDVSTGTSSNGGRLFGRQAWAGLQSNSIGSFVMGLVDTPSSTTGSFDMFALVDPFAGAWGINTIGSTFIAANSSNGRWDNAIAWASPSWGGLKLGAEYTFNRSGTETAPSDTNTRAYALGASFGWRLLYVAATYDVYQFPSLANQPDEKLFQIGAAVDFTIVKLYGAYARQDNISQIQVANFPGYPVTVVAHDADAYMLGVTAPLFGGTIRGSYQWFNSNNINTASYQFEPDFYVWGVGYDYPFSRRTNMYIGYGQRSWNGTIVQTPVAISTPSQRVDREQFALGLRHLF